MNLWCWNFWQTLAKVEVSCFPSFQVTSSFLLSLIYFLKDLLFLLCLYCKRKMVKYSNIQIIWVVKSEENWSSICLWLINTQNESHNMSAKKQSNFFLLNPWHSYIQWHIGFFTYINDIDTYFLLRVRREEKVNIMTY